MSENNSIKNHEDGLKELAESLNGFFSSKVTVGESIKVGDVLLIPFNDVSYGIGVGEYQGKAGGTAGGLGAKMSPTAILMIQGSSVRLINIKNEQAVVKLIDMVPGIVNSVPDIVDRFKLRFAKNDPDVHKTVNDMKENEERT